MQRPYVKFVTRKKFYDIIYLKEGECMVRTQIWAHRGASGYAPENTLPAFQKAIEMESDGVELDVQMTKDGKLVVIHDETVNRVSNGKGWVKDYSLDELRKLKIQGKFTGYQSLKIPLLEEVFALLSETALIVNVELKNGVIFYEGMEEKLLELTRTMGMENRVCYSSFNHYSMIRLKEMDRAVKVGFLYSDGYISMPDYAQKYDVQALHPALYNLQYPGFINECKEKDIKLHVWTVNREKDIRMLCQNEIDVVITNYPDIGRKVVSEYEESN